MYECWSVHTFHLSKNSFNRGLVLNVNYKKSLLLPLSRLEFLAPIVILMTMFTLRSCINLGYTYGAPRDRDISHARCLVPLLCLRLHIANCVCGPPLNLSGNVSFSLSLYVTNNNSNLFLLCGRSILKKKITLCSTYNTK